MMIRSDKIGKGSKMMPVELTLSPNAHLAFRLECFLDLTFAKFTAKS